MYVCVFLRMPVLTCSHKLLGTFHGAYMDYLHWNSYIQHAMAYGISQQRAMAYGICHEISPQEKLMTAQEKLIPAQEKLIPAQKKLIRISHE